MRTVGHSIWRGPLLMIMVGAVAVAAVGPVYGWAQSLPIGAIALTAAMYSYFMARRDTDRGALARGRLDERQQLLRWQAWSFSAHMTFAASAVGALLAAILRYPVWPLLGLHRVSVRCLLHRPGQVQVPRRIVSAALTRYSRSVSLEGTWSGA
jgi:hypothetical protein